MIETLGVKIVWSVGIDDWYSEVLSFNVAYRWCLGGVVYRTANHICTFVYL